MKTPRQIVQDTYDNNPKLKEQLDFYGLTLEDVGIQFIQSNEYYNHNEPIILYYSLEEEKVIRCFVSFTHIKTEESLRKKRLERISKGKYFLEKTF